jgi:hypothetical protein
LIGAASRRAVVVAIARSSFTFEASSPPRTIGTAADAALAAAATIAG